jgi:hypothetical protein
VINVLSNKDQLDTIILEGSDNLTPKILNHILQYKNITCIILSKILPLISDIAVIDMINQALQEKRKICYMLSNNYFDTVKAFIDELDEEKKKLLLKNIHALR